MVSAVSSHTINEISFLLLLLMLFRCTVAVTSIVAVLREEAPFWTLLNTYSQVVV